ncbi:DUF3426 domain-containing protein [Sneathiella chinensis]|uniref:DUF3426 domain-containing protein n=1 Tax=Sneathiella chinensis TaxID=349750 RepID=A0ABQ5U218_9PROT|nr:DUF3426 domain-containing protein [Sneathiella chinensis]GLQ05319.1 hypothetical protein GCM10007924_05400 [Sneathiella chinensis]
MPKQVAGDEPVEGLEAEAEVAGDAGLSIEEMSARKPRVPRERIPVPEKKKSGWLGWLIFLLLLAAIVAGGYYGRNQVVSVWPPAAKLYQKLKLDVQTRNTLGLEIRDLTTRSVVENGVTRLTVVGNIVNITETDRPIPRISIQLIDDAGDHVYSWSTSIEQTLLEGWGSVEFTSSMNQPPEDAKQVRANLLPLSDPEGKAAN